nr:hypothetical protein CFP56_76197 [Quercus suber]
MSPKTKGFQMKLLRFSVVKGISGERLGAQARRGGVKAPQGSAFLEPRRLRRYKALVPQGRLTPLSTLLSTTISEDLELWNQLW